MRRTAQLQGIEQKTELHLPFLADAKHVEDGLLHGRIVNANGAAAHFRAVQHEVVGARQRLLWFRPQLRHIASWLRERMMAWRQRLAALLEHRKLGDPKRRPTIFKEAQRFAKVVAQSAHRIVDDVGRVCAEKHDVVGGGVNAAQNRLQRRRIEELQDRRLQPFNALGAVVHFDVGEALGTVASDETHVVVQFAPGKAICRPRRIHCHHAPAGIVGGAAEHLEGRVRDEVGDIDQPQRIAQVRRIAAVALDGFRVGQHREVRQFDVDQLSEQRLHQALA